MLPTGLLERLGSMAIGRAASGASKSIQNRRQDSPRAFGRDLFGFYEGLGSYAETARLLALYVDGLDMAKTWSFDSDLDRCNALSAELNTIVGDLIEVLWPMLEEQYGPIADEIFDVARARRAEHRGKVLAVIDPELAELVRACYATDMSAIWLARGLNAIYFDRERLEVSTVEVPGQDLAALLAHVREMGSAVHGALSGPPDQPPRWVPPEAVAIMSLTDDSSRVIALVEMLRKNAEDVASLRSAVGEALRQHFSLGDLL